MSHLESLDGEMQLLTQRRDEALKQTRILEEKVRMLVGGLGLP
jgi:hypothetical protein